MAEHEHDHDRDGEHPVGEVLERDEEAPERDPEREARKIVALSQIRKYGDPVLRMRANDVEAFDEELERLAERMTHLMHDADGIGLAATQVGILRRLFVFSHEDEDYVLVNPEITSRSRGAGIDDEGCLSLGPVRVPVERACSVTIEGKDARGEDVRFELEGFSARVVQHELDHLDGTLMIDRTDPESRRDALRQLRPRLALA
jgi:peptide deformylase